MITISDIQLTDAYIEELSNSEMEAITGGFVITLSVAAGIAIGSAFVAGVGTGVALYAATK